MTQFRFRVVAVESRTTALRSKLIAECRPYAVKLAEEDREKPLIPSREFNAVRVVTADVEILSQVPGMGSKKAARIRELVG